MREGPPTQVLMAMSTMEVGVDTFSLTLGRGVLSCSSRGLSHLKRRERTEKEQMSTPLPATELKMPPRKPGDGGEPPPHPLPAAPPPASHQTEGSRRRSSSCVP